MPGLTLAKTNAIIETAFARAKEINLKPLGIVVFDAGGHVVAFQKQDGASFLRFEVASGKAYGALAVGAGSRRVEAMAKERPHFMQGLSGVSGDTSDNDELVAIAGIEAAGFEADGG